MYYTKYAEKKFEVLNKYKVFLTKEQVEACLSSPEKTDKKDKYFTAEREGVRVVYRKEDGEIKVITFYPVKK